jgi:hypothetical protein
VGSNPTSAILETNMKNFEFYRRFKNGKLAKSPICKLWADTEKEAWNIFSDREYWMNYPDTTQFVIK